MLKIAHIADNHLRDRQYSLNERGNDFYVGLKNAIKAAIDSGADIIICAGDLFDVSRPSANNVSVRLKEINSYLIEKNVPMYVISGNHDISCCDWIGVYETGKGGVIPIDNKEIITESGLSIYGIPYCAPNKFREIIKDPKTYDVVVWHSEIAEFVTFGGTDFVSIDDVPEGKCQVLMMGHLHIHKKIKRDTDGMVVAYPGSSELCSSSEDANKSLYLYTFDENNKLVNIEDIPFKTREVQKFKLRTELDVENCITSIKDNTLIFLGYDRNLHNVLTRIYTVVNDTNILKPYLLPAEKEVILKTKDEKIGTAIDYMREHLKDVIDEETEKRIGELCVACIDSNADHRLFIEKLIESSLTCK